MYTWQGPNKTYTKWVLVPLWIAHIAFTFVVVGGLGYAMLEISGQPDFSGRVPPALSASMSFCLIALIIEPVEMVFLSYRILEPWLYLTLQIFKTLVGTILLFAGIYIVVQTTLPSVTLGSAVVIVFVVLIGFMTLTFYASLIYAAIVLHKHRKSGVYRSVEKRDRRDDESM